MAPQNRPICNMCPASLAVKAVHDHQLQQLQHDTACLQSLTVTARPHPQKAQPPTATSQTSPWFQSPARSPVQPADAACLHLPDPPTPRRNHDLTHLFKRLWMAEPRSSGFAAVAPKSEKNLAAQCSGVALHDVRVRAGSTSKPTL